MTVAELIAELQKLPPNARVIASHNGMEYAVEAEDVFTGVRYFETSHRFTRAPKDGYVAHRVVSLS